MYCRNQQQGRGQQNQNQQSPGQRTEEEDDPLALKDENDSALLTIFMYYVQVPSLLKVKLLYEGNRYVFCSNIV